MASILQEMGNTGEARSVTSDVTKDHSGCYVGTSIKEQEFKKKNMSSPGKGW